MAPSMMRSANSRQSLTRGSGASGTGTSRKSHSGCQPSAAATQQALGGTTARTSAIYRSIRPHHVGVEDLAHVAQQTARCHMAFGYKPM